MSWLKLWQWIYLKAEGICKAEYRNQNHQDFKCPNCDTWRSVWSIKKDIDPLSIDHGIWLIECGQCGEQTYWNFEIAPVGIRCDRHGRPTVFTI